MVRSGTESTQCVVVVSIPTERHTLVLVVGRIGTGEVDGCSKNKKNGRFILPRNGYQ